jgi:hypothetical protein
MSLSFKKNGIIGGPLSNQVTSQLKQRRNILLKRNEREADDISYLTTNTGWCKVTSAVNVDENFNFKTPGVTGDFTSRLADRYQLFGGTYPFSNRTSGFSTFGEERLFDYDSTYQESDTQGIVPMPGITSFQVTSQGTYGTLRAGSFNFTVHSTEEFDILEKLYLRPGFTVLMEWGHSSYISNDGEYTNSTTYYDIKKFLNKKNELELRKELLKLRLDNSFNYDFLYGFVKNFTWSFNGIGYECQVDVISKGEVISSIGALFSTKSGKEKQENYKNEEKASEVETILSILKNSAGASSYQEEQVDLGTIQDEVKFTFLNQLDEKYSEVFLDSDIIVGNFTSNTSYNTSNSFKYISLRDFFKLINTAGILKGPDGKNIVSFFTGTENSPAFTTFNEHVALDPYICILPGRKNEYSYLISSQISNIIEEEILSIYVNVDYILGIYKQIKERTDNTVFDVVNKILKGIQDNLGDINEFAVHYDEDESIYYTVDRQVIPSEKFFDKDPNSNEGSALSYIDTVGLGSEVTNLKVESKLSGNLTTMIAIAAQANSNDTSDSKVLNVQKWNLGLVDRHLATKTTGTTEKETSQEPFKVDEEDKNRWIKFVEEVNKSNNAVLVDLPQQHFVNQKELHTSITQDFLKELTESRNLNAPGIIPFELSFTIKGISGMKIGQAFKINEFFLPERYRGRTAFIITGIDHKVSNNQWFTDIGTQLIIT